jgi:hypothetical protein
MATYMSSLQIQYGPKTTYDRDVGQSGSRWSTHGGEVTVEHVCQVMTECIPENVMKDVDTIIDMGCGTGIVCAASAMLFHRKTISNWGRLFNHTITTF